VTQANEEPGLAGPGSSGRQSQVLPEIRQSRHGYKLRTQAHPLSERGDDLYETPEVATEALLEAENIPQPAAGFAAIVRVLRRHGHRVYASDLRHYDSPFLDGGGRDFLKERWLPDDGVEAILTNPPYQLATEFVAHGIKLCPKVYMLCKLTFAESQRRTEILDSGQLARIYLFKSRLPMMHRHGWQGPKASSAFCFAWFCWRHDHTGPAEFHRIDWTRP
jgi:hypothetical protein